MGTGHPAGRGRDRHHRPREPADRRAEPTCWLASPTPLGRSCPAAAPRHPATASPRRSWARACGSWPRGAPRPSTAASWRRPLLAFLQQEGALFEPDDFARQEAARLHADHRGLPRPHRLRDGAALAGLPAPEQLNHPGGLRPGGPLALRRPTRIHLLVEAKKLAFADRNRYAGRPGLRGLGPLEQLLSKDHAARPGGRSTGPGRGDGARGPGRRAQRRHQLLRGGRRERQRRLVHPQPVGAFGSGVRRRRHRHHAQQPGGPRLQPGPRVTPT